MNRPHFFLFLAAEGLLCATRSPLRAREGLEAASLLGLEHGCDTTTVWNGRPENQRTGTAGASGSSQKFALPEPVPPSRGGAFGTRPRPADCSGSQGDLGAAVREH